MARRSILHTEKTVRQRIEGRTDLVEALQNPSLQSVSAFLGLVADCLDDLNRTKGLAGEESALVKYNVIQSAYPALLSYRAGGTRQATDFVIDTWKRYSIRRSGRQSRQILESPELRAVFNVAVSELVQSEEKDLQARQILRRLMVHLGLSQDEVGRMFEVSGETIRRWERGQNRVPDLKMAALNSADGALTRLLHLFRPERLSQVIRQQAEGFEGERALDWILRGRMAEVVDRYDSALFYQA